MWKHEHRPGMVFKDPVPPLEKFMFSGKSLLVGKTPGGIFQHAAVMFVFRSYRLEEADRIGLVHQYGDFQFPGRIPYRCKPLIIDVYQLSGRITVMKPKLLQYLQPLCAFFNMAMQYPNRLFNKLTGIGEERLVHGLCEVRSRETIEA